MNNQDYYNKEYVPQVNKIGKITGYLGVLLSFTPALVLAVVYGILPKPAALLTAFISGASAFGVLWFVEPISYFPVVGAAGTYMAFLSGNISNMRIPCASTGGSRCRTRNRKRICCCNPWNGSIYRDQRICSYNWSNSWNFCIIHASRYDQSRIKLLAASFIWSFISTIWNENEKTQRHHGCICDHLIFYDRNGIF